MSKNSEPIPVIDLFAGPGGLGEGFSVYSGTDGIPAFRLVLSIEKDENAHKTLELRSFFRQFGYGHAPEKYYDYLRGKISRQALFTSYPRESLEAARIAWHAELGHTDFPPEMVDQKIETSLSEAATWVLIGGPPCQAYSMVGRSRLRGKDPERYENDPRHFLYKEYLRILAVHRPPFFVFENVKGILSSKINGSNAFAHILSDLQEPKLQDESGTPRKRRMSDTLRYRIFPLSTGTATFFSSKDVSNYVIQTEKHGIPQSRHRVILLGVRSDIRFAPRPLELNDSFVPAGEVIEDLPRLRSGLSREKDDSDLWAKAVKSVVESRWFQELPINDPLQIEIISACETLSASMTMGGQFIASSQKPVRYRDWYFDKKLNGVCNHSARLHIRQDLHRYLFASCFAKVHKYSPLLKDFPPELLPNHKNVENAVKSKTRMFSDRFRVQLSGYPATTITSHLAKDGHYFIHSDPTQCRSLTVREAARVQTFPDNYFFEGPRTSQYEQVGNAVPPLLAFSIADVVFNLIELHRNQATGIQAVSNRSQGHKHFQVTLW